LFILQVYNFNVLDEDLSSLSLESDGKSVTKHVSQELWHSLDLNKSVLVDIKVVPSILKVVLKNRLIVAGMSFDNLGCSTLSSCFIKEERSIWLTIFILHFDSIVLDERSHKIVISLLTESVWDISGVGTINSTIFPSSEVIDILSLDILFIR